MRLEGGPSAEAHRRAERLHKAIVKGYVPRYVNLTRACDGSGGGAPESVDLQEYDSVQFPLRVHSSWGAERWTEIVLLRGGHEASFVTALSPPVLTRASHRLYVRATRTGLLGAVRTGGQHCTDAVRVPASGVPYVPRTVAPQEPAAPSVRPAPLPAPVHAGGRGGADAGPRLHPLHGQAHGRGAGDAPEQLHRQAECERGSGGHRGPRGGAAAARLLATKGRAAV